MIADVAIFAVVTPSDAPVESAILAVVTAFACNCVAPIESSAVPSVSILCPKTNPKNANPLAGAVVKVRVLAATV